MTSRGYATTKHGAARIGGGEFTTRGRDETTPGDDSTTPGGTATTQRNPGEATVLRGNDGIKKESVKEAESMKEKCRL